MPTNLNGRWTDQHFSFNYEHDWYSPRKNIQRPDGATLYDVSVLKEGAKFAVHFCPEACEIWVVDVLGLREHVYFDTDWQIAYCPARVSSGPATARGYLVSCQRALEFGERFDMPPKLATRLLEAKTKAEAGLFAERAFLWLVNERDFFPAFLKAPARKSGQQDDVCNGIDFWVADFVPVQVKLDRPGGVRGTGNLFVQTHTLPLRDQNDWHGYKY